MLILKLHFDYIISMFKFELRFMGVGNRSTRRKPSTCRQSLRNFGVTNNLMQHVAVIPVIMLKYLRYTSMDQQRFYGRQIWIPFYCRFWSYYLVHFPPKCSMRCDTQMSSCLESFFGVEFGVKFGVIF